MSIDNFGRVFNNEEISLGISRTVAGDFNTFHKRTENVATPYRDKDDGNAKFVLKNGFMYVTKSWKFFMLGIILLYT